MSSFPSQLTTDDKKSPSLQPTLLPLYKESTPAPSRRELAGSELLCFVLQAFLCFSSTFAILLTVTLYVLQQLRGFHQLMRITIFFPIWGVLSVLGITAEALAYGLWCIRKEWSWSTRDLFGDIGAPDEYGLPVLAIYMKLFCRICSIITLVVDDCLEVEKKKGLVEKGHGGSASSGLS
ncbi:hypothetical protein F4805DRAFT_460548 [Annulohypoxylon moriforme]|nr:hypothetical protein F4805DRAFT_460548 [Annulohypoxylon moriforme]